MANLLNVAIVESILSLHALGWSQRRIAVELGVDRETVGKYVLQRSCGAKPANLPTGSGDPKPASFPVSRLPTQNQPVTCRPGRATCRPPKQAVQQPVRLLHPRRCRRAR